MLLQSEFSYVDSLDCPQNAVSSSDGSRSEIQRVSMLEPEIFKKAQNIHPGAKTLELTVSKNSVNSRATLF
jgi:hypothetical protein